MNGKIRALVVLVAMASAAAIGWALSDWMLADRSGPAQGQRGASAIGGPFSLTDGDGKTWTDQDFRGKLVLIYFGYSFCPDVCPTSLGAAAAALDQLGAAGENIVPLFITVDPDRDKGQALKEYAAAFHPRMIGLGGAPDAIAAAARAFRVYYKKTTPEDGSAYLVDHSSILYLMGRDGKFITHFTHAATPEDIAAGLRRYL